MALTSTAVKAQSISEKFPFDSKYLSVNGHKIHYIDEGQGNPILFLHGVPMSSYSWRNVVPHLLDTARCIAIDFMGFGKSDKPDIDYTFDNQYAYLEGFIEKLGLVNITLVMTDIGGVLGMHYAVNHPEKVKAMVMMETPIGDAETFYKNGGMMQRMLFWMGGKDKMGYNMFVKRNMFIKMMPMLIKRKLTKYEKEYYSEPFPTQASRKAMFVLVNTFPKKGKKAAKGDLGDYLNKNAKGLMQSQHPKLLLYAKPGMLTNKKVLEWSNENLPQLTTQQLGKAKHLMEEDLPHEIGNAIREWYLEL